MLSVLAVPGLLNASPSVAPQALAQQWAGIYNPGKVLGPRFAMLASLGYGYLAYHRSGGRGGGGGAGTGAWALAPFAGAAALTLAIAPWTVLVMDGTNQALLRVAEGGGAGAVVGEEEKKKREVAELLARWKGLNLVRSLFPLAGAVIGFWGLVA